MGNFGSDQLFGGSGDDALLGDNPNGPPVPGTDVCAGNDGFDVVVPGTCEVLRSIEGDFTPSP